LTANPLAADLDHILAETQGLWDGLRGQHVFMTGGTGFFGRWLLESFVWVNDRLNLGAQVTVLTRSPDAFRGQAPHLAGDPAIHLAAGDVRTFDFPQGEFSHVIHAATEADLSLMATAPLQVFDVNVEGTRRVLEFARQAGARHFLFTSSGAVYGRQPAALERIPEDFPGGPDPTDTHSTYGIAGEAKRAAESLCALYARQFGPTTVIARCFTFVGPHLPLDGKFAIGNFLRDATAGTPIRVGGDGTPYRSYLYAADLAIWLWTLLIRGASGQAYNVGSELGLPLAAVARAVGDGVTPPLPVHIAQVPDPALPPSRYVPCTRKARIELGLRETVDLKESIRRSLGWLQQHPRS
jgi:dTDP-glucose 4,6-dehydratase